MGTTMFWDIPTFTTLARKIIKGAINKGSGSSRKGFPRAKGEKKCYEGTKGLLVSLVPLGEIDENPEEPIAFGDGVVADDLETRSKW